MTDASPPVAAPDAATAAQALTIAKNAGGAAFLAEHSRLAAAGAVVGREDAQLAAQLQSHREGIDPALLAPQQSETAPPPDYIVQLPAPLAHGLNDKGRLEVAQDAKAFVGAMGLSLEQGSETARVLLRDVTNLAQMPAAERDAQLSTWRQQAHQAFGDRLEGMAATIDRYIAAIAPKNALVAKWAERSAFVNPEMIGRLYWAAVKAGHGPKVGTSP